MYSETKDCIFCFCCLCFDRSSRSFLGSVGVNDWSHVSAILKAHENVSSHMLAYQSWIETEKRLNSGNTIDRVEQLLIVKESERWSNVLNRLMNIILYLAENNIAFCGSSDKLYTKNNGKYLGLIQLLAKFDPVMQEHVGRILKDELSVHYCVSRWQILNDHVISFTLKKPSDTRWEAKISSVKAVRYQVADIHDALISLSEKEEKHDHEIAHEEITLSCQLKDFSFLVSLVIWYDILFQVNVVSKSMQSQSMDVIKTVELIHGCIKFLEEYKKNGFENAISSAKELAKVLEGVPEFQATKRIRYVKRHFDYESRDDQIATTPKKQFEVEFFITLLDVAIMSVRERFQQLNQHAETWGFLYKITELPNREQLEKHCSDLQLALTTGEDADIEGGPLCDELISIQKFVENMAMPTPLNTLNFIKTSKLEDLYPNTWVSLRILLTTPVSVATGERSFSKLKLIKTYLRSSMSQEMLSSLATLSIENDVSPNRFCRIDQKFC
ncbi:uncharacterized protein LOC134911440 [Pseudophryne corroboree]|uniref:uncharacterized protein LOC134911440 n=1 Tax=Pseudophryne corroboree TaxID=495146 RepID=UPI003081D047